MKSLCKVTQFIVLALDNPESSALSLLVISIFPIQIVTFLSISSSSNEVIINLELLNVKCLLYIQETASENFSTYNKISINYMIWVELTSPVPTVP